jgi:hypothetical protein
VTIDKDSSEMLELRRNWEPDDETFMSRRVFVKFGYIPALGFYDFGLMHLLGNGTKALTAAWREALDLGMLKNFPGYIYNEGVIRNWSNQNIIPPGGGLGIKVPSGVPLSQVISPLPYGDLSPGHMVFIKEVQDRMDRIGGVAEVQVGEGRADAPVGTTIALIEQATKVIAAVHIGLCASLAEEFQLLKERYRQNPEAFWRWNKKGYAWEEGLFLRALEDNEIVPAADPNTPSHLQRVMRAQAVKQVAMLRPDLYDMKRVDTFVFQMIGVADPEQFFLPPQPPQEAPLDPQAMATMAVVQQKQQQAQQDSAAKMAQIQAKAAESQQEHEARMAEMSVDAANQEKDRQEAAQAQVVESSDRAADRASRERVAALRLESDQMKMQHASGENALDRAQGAPPGGSTEPGAG